MKNKKSTQNLFGLRTFGKYGLQSDKAGLAFFSVQPTNISVLSAENISPRAAGRVVPRSCWSAARRA